MSYAYFGTTTSDSIVVDLIWPPKEKHILDIKYPHICFKCKKELSWVELFNANMNDFWSFNAYKGYKILKKLWRSRDIEFYCCSCYMIFSSFR